MRKAHRIAVLLLAAVAMCVPVRVRSADKRQEDPEHQAKLDVVVSELVLENATLQEAALRLQEKTHANLFVDANALEGEGYPLDKKIRMRLYDLELGKALAVLVSAYEERGVALGFRLCDGVIRIAPLVSLRFSGTPTTLVYDIHDLVERFLTPNDLLAADLRPLVGGGPMRAGQPAPPSTTQRVNPALPERVTNFSRQENIDMIFRLIEECVDADTWRDNGGQIGNLKELGGLLVVTQLPENQKQVEAVLRNLRRMRDAIDRGDPDRGKGIDLLKK
jgi:hypothetical protein